jgi:hypothetical protein
VSWPAPAHDDSTTAVDVTPIDARDERKAKQIAGNETLTKIETELFTQP